MTNVMITAISKVQEHSALKWEKTLINDDEKGNNTQVLTCVFEIFYKKKTEIRSAVSCLKVNRSKK